jgi:serine/threonine-protein kinase
MEPIVINQRYRLDKRIGAGGMATVYGGHDMLLDRPVAIKILQEPYADTPDFRQRFIEEARAAARLEHSNIVHIYDVGKDGNNHPYIVMERVDGEDLKSLIRRERPLPVSRALNLARQICAGVGHAHRTGLVHCDLKPQNILLTTSGQIKVTDFGIARAFRAGNPPPETKEPAAAVVWGSPHYISPEQAAGLPPTPASDVYSIGIVLYEMLTGAPPFHAQDPAALILKHLREDPPSLTSQNPRVPSGLDWLVRKTLAKEPANRYRNADQLGMAIEEYMQHGEELTLPHAAVSAPPKPTGQAQRRPTTVETEVGLPVQPTPPGAQPRREPQSEPHHDGVDWRMWGLLVMATIAVLGVVALWSYVFQAYTQPAVTPPPIIETPQVTPTPVGERVTVPQLIGLSAPDAQRLAEGLNLGLSIVREQETTDARPGTVLEQTPRAGARVSSGTEINIVLARGRAFTMPDVVGYQLQTVRNGLESEGLLLNIIEVGSQEQADLILKQQPAAGSEIRAGSPITLTVSGGSDAPIPLQVNLSNVVILEDAQISQATFRPGEGIGVTLRWRCLTPLETSYKVFVHLLTPNLQTLITQHDGEPVNGLRPTTTWIPGEIIPDPHQLAIPEGTPSGTYQIRVGLYNEAGRLPVVSSGKTETEFDSILVTEVKIAP